jgi:hypothetical protein
MFSISGPQVLVLACSMCLPALLPAGEPAQQEQQRDRKLADPKAKQEEKALTGCIDEQEGNRYVLIDARSLAPIATLEAVGFPNESFAKHLGNTVVVKGTLDSSLPRPVMKARSVEFIGNGCGQKQLKQ